MPSIRNLVILFTRYPQSGKCKTRLIPALGAEGAVQIHKQLVAHILHELVVFLSSRRDSDLHIYYDGGSRKEMQEWLGNSKSYRQQQGKNLGQRMENALHHGLQTRHNTILIGSDCPAIDASLLEAGFTALQYNDIVLGPAHDGGYYLIGIANRCRDTPWRELFTNIPWGTDTVFSQTLAKAGQYELRTHLLKQLHDIDTPEDLKHFNHCPHSERS